METLEKKGKGSALLPFLLFIVIYLGALSSFHTPLFV